MTGFCVCEHSFTLSSWIFFFLFETLFLFDYEICLSFSIRSFLTFIWTSTWGCLLSTLCRQSLSEKTEKNLLKTKLRESSISDGQSVFDTPGIQSQFLQEFRLLLNSHFFNFSLQSLSYSPCRFFVGISLARLLVLSLPHSAFHNSRPPVSTWFFTLPTCAPDLSASIVILLLCRSRVWCVAGLRVNQLSQYSSSIQFSLIH